MGVGETLALENWKEMPKTPSAVLQDQRGTLTTSMTSSAGLEDRKGTPATSSAVFQDRKGIPTARTTTTTATSSAALQNWKGRTSSRASLDISSRISFWRSKTREESIEILSKGGGSGGGRGGGGTVKRKRSSTSVDGHDSSGITGSDAKDDDD